MRVLRVYTILRDDSRLLVLLMVSRGGGSGESEGDVREVGGWVVVASLGVPADQTILDREPFALSDCSDLCQLKLLTMNEEVR